eukprot:m.10643 g.10643  ORF g.10643 m.10643 type:complete len:341 (+) comp22521_c0_seq1:193-1215(+)
MADVDETLSRDAEGLQLQVSVPRHSVPFHVANLDETVAEFVARVESEQEVLLKDYRLFHGDRKLPRNKRLRDCEIKDGSMLVLKRLRTVAVGFSSDLNAGQLTQSCPVSEEEDEVDEVDEGDESIVNGQPESGADFEEKRKLEAARQLERLWCGPGKEDKENKEGTEPEILPYSFNPGAALFPPIPHPYEIGMSMKEEKGGVCQATGMLSPPPLLATYRSPATLMPGSRFIPSGGALYWASSSSLRNGEPAPTANRITRYYKSLPQNPLIWTSEHVQHWLHALQVKFELPTLDKSKFRMNGRGLALMKLQGFQYRLGNEHGELAYRDFQELRSSNARITN